VFVSVGGRRRRRIGYPVWLCLRHLAEVGIHHRVLVWPCMCFSCICMCCQCSVGVVVVVKRGELVSVDSFWNLIIADLVLVVVSQFDWD
jgi:hypothetical protein